MRTKTILMAVSALLVFLVPSAFADKPSWAGKGGKPTQEEKNMHKEKMTSKHKYKKEHKKGRDDDDEEKYDDDNDNEKSSSKSDSDKEESSKSSDDYLNKKIDETKKKWIDKAFGSDEK